MAQAEQNERNLIYQLIYYAVTVAYAGNQAIHIYYCDCIHTHYPITAWIICLAMSSIYSVSACRKQTFEAQ